eukprot:1170464-Pyramimonas_sp.AAC.1
MRKGGLSGRGGRHLSSLACVSGVPQVAQHSEGPQVSQASEDPRRACHGTRGAAARLDSDPGALGFYSGKCCLWEAAGGFLGAGLGLRSVG